MGPIHVNLVQLAESLGVEESVIESWVKHEGLPCVRDSGRLIFDRAQVAAWATERGMAAKAGFLGATSGPSASEVDLARLVRNGGIWRGVAVADVPATLAAAMQRLPAVSPEIRKMLAQRVQAPNAITWAPVGNGIALPHLRSRVALGKDSGLIAIIFLKAPLTLGESEGGGQVDRLIFFMPPTPRAHLEVLAALSTAMIRGGLATRLKAGLTDQQILDGLSSNAWVTPTTEAQT